jgi:Carbohydrate esterase, sialic acid-specific acetylesterase
MDIYKSRFSPIRFLFFIFFLILFFLMLVGCTVPYQGKKPGADPDFHLYLLVGQSNMAGRGALDAAAKTAHPQVMMLDKSHQWVPATDPLHFDKPAVVGVGPGLTFGQEMAAHAAKKVRIGLIPCAVGGSSIDAWQNGGFDQATNTHPYDDALARVWAARQSGVIKGIIWHQGESDSSPEKAAAYLPKLINLVAALRRELGDEQLPFVAGELGYYKEPYQLINRQLELLPRQVPYTAVVSAKGLNHKGDVTHFDTESARELGHRYAAAMIRLQAQ